MHSASVRAVKPQDTGTTMAGNMTAPAERVDAAACRTPTEPTADGES
ncbi:hypothetical protein AB0G32_35320 [Streptomyces sp. NPDC023723]